MKLNFTPKKYTWICTKGKNFWVWKDIINYHARILEIRATLRTNRLNFQIITLYIHKDFIESTDTVIKRANMFS